MTRFSIKSNIRIQILQNKRHNPNVYRPKWSKREKKTWKNKNFMQMGQLGCYKCKSCLELIHSILSNSTLLAIKTILFESLKIIVLKREITNSSLFKQTIDCILNLLFEFFFSCAFCNFLFHIDGGFIDSKLQAIIFFISWVNRLCVQRILLSILCWIVDLIHPLAWILYQ